jgi:hypothetical protein
MKVSGCTFSFAGKEKVPKRNLAAYVLFYESFVLWLGYCYPKSPEAAGRR